MGRRKEVVTVYFDPETYAALRALTANTSVPTAVYIREAVDEWLTRRRAKPTPATGHAARMPG